MKTLKDLKKEAVENQRRPLGWYRKNGLTSLRGDTTMSEALNGFRDDAKDAWRKE